MVFLGGKVCGDGVLDGSGLYRHDIICLRLNRGKRLNQNCFADLLAQ